ncbi:hypothetical protein D3C71_1409620 [compost metagenome]
MLLEQFQYEPELSQRGVGAITHRIIEEIAHQDVAEVEGINQSSISVLIHLIDELGVIVTSVDV